MIFFINPEVGSTVAKGYNLVGEEPRCVDRDLFIIDVLIYSTVTALKDILFVVDSNQKYIGSFLIAELGNPKQQDLDLVSRAVLIRRG